MTFLRRGAGGDDEGEARFEAIADAAPVMMWIADASKACTWFNLPWLQFTGRRLQEHIGDGWSFARGEGWFTVMVADGLGHGVDAEGPSRSAVATFLAAPSESPSRIIERAHEALGGGRGAAVAVARVEGREVRYAGVGNIAGSVIEDSTTRHMVSHPGIVGHRMSRVQEFTYPWSERSLLVMASDGIKTQWRLDSYPGLVRRHPTLVAATIWRDFSRGRDDATVVVAQAAALR